MKVHAFVLVVALTTFAVVRGDDPTISLPGVQDLSELPDPSHDAIHDCILTTILVTLTIASSLLQLPPPSTKLSMARRLLWSSSTLLGECHILKSHNQYISIIIYRDIQLHYPYVLMGCRCGHCKAMTGEYKKLGELVAADPSLNSQVIIAKVL